MFFLLFLFLFTYTQIIDNVYYRGSWRIREGNLFRNNLVGEGYVEMKLDNSSFTTVSLRSNNKKNNVPKVDVAGDYTFIIGQVGFRHGFYMGDEYEYNILYGILNPSSNRIYCYVFSPEIATDILNRGNPFHFMKFKEPYPHPLKGQEYLSPFFTPETEADRDVNIAYNSLFRLYQNKITQDNGYVFQQLTEDDVYVYKGYLQVTFLEDVDEEENEFEDVHVIKNIHSLDGSIYGISKKTVRSTIELSVKTTLPQTIVGQLLNYCILISSLMTVGLLTLLYQMSVSKTPSGAARVSVVTIIFLILIDCYSSIFHIVVCMQYGTGSFFILSFVILIYGVTVFGFEMKFLVDVWKATRPGGTSIRDLRRKLGALYGRFYICFFIGLFILFKYPQTLKYICFILFSCWWPQIVFNFYYDVQKSLNPVYVLTSSISKLATLCYFYLYRSNFLMVEQDVYFIIGLLCYVFLQNTVLIVQRVTGPRFYGIAKCGKKKYDYKKPIPEEIIERGECHCTICLENVNEVNGDHMTTPCNHVFHEECLKRWCEEKLECPVCRTSLPFFE